MKYTYEFKNGFILEKSSGWIVSLYHINDIQFQDAFRVQKSILNHSTKKSYIAFKRINRYIKANHPEFLI